ncbi:hypothetical protein [Aestuariicoccus sp. MJ-SS9]|uniref:hypothetical protein n=1 Tax=Aestuariicoccus sp. MJ-SS9 TaxID=3079855 RepID=UPI00290FA21C|nr:hypothetical protein [Aestuariicoccus sp. MJ-SS9]MDU8912844.1 hypothetical protein [Aestuariicoccus sp. MJ-SS9]
MLVVNQGVAPARFGSIGVMTSANPAHTNGASKDPAMAHAPMQLGQDPQFEPFLHAPLGEDRRGSSVTVLSMLARLGVDPWSEASELSRLPAAAARQRLEALMTRFHDVPTPVPDRSRIVSGLLALLPRRATTAISPQDGTSAKLALPPQGSPFYWIVAAALFVGWVAMLAQGQ